MPQFQILYSPSIDEWRPITTDFCLLPCDQSNLWASFEEADIARKRITLSFPGTQFRIVLANTGARDADWQARERQRFADGTYTCVPWHAEAWYQARHEEHFCHVSTEQPGKIAFTENPGKGAADRQLVMSPGRYLHRFFSDHLGNEAIERWCARLSVQLQEDTLKITQDADEIEDVYVGGPCSCMAHPADDFESSCHPVRVYAGPDTALAYIGARDDARARSVVWPDRKIYTTVYGDVSRLKLLLETAGYIKGDLEGARLQRIEDDDAFVVPYIDAGDDLADTGEFLVVGRGTIPSGNTNGLGIVPWYCPRCDNQTRPYEVVNFADGASEEWCHNCFSNHTTFCEHNEEAYADNEDFVTVYSNDGEHTVLEDSAEKFGAIYLENRGEWWDRNCCGECDGTAEMFHEDELAEYYGERLCGECLPEPLDDADAFQCHAHVVDYRRVLDEGSAPTGRLNEHHEGDVIGEGDEHVSAGSASQGLESSQPDSSGIARGRVAANQFSGMIDTRVLPAEMVPPANAETLVNAGA